MARKNRRKVTQVRPISEKEIIMGNTVAKKQGVISEDTYRQEILDKFDWMSKASSRGTSNRPMDKSKEVSISWLPISKNRKHAQLSIIVRYNLCKKLTGTEYVQLCAHKNRIYFREANPQVGFKLYKASGTTPENRYTKMNAEEHMKEFIGDYDLRYDEFLELYYVEKEN